MDKGPCAFLFYNGAAAFFDENDQPIYEFQEYGWKGLHLFREKYPKGRVLMQSADPIPHRMIPLLLENILDPREIYE